MNDASDNPTGTRDTHVWCQFAGPGRGDCEHFIGYPSPIHKPGEHDGPDDTMDVYGIPNGWCVSCWRAHQLVEARQRIRELSELLEEHRQQYANKCLELIEVRKLLPP